MDKNEMKAVVTVKFDEEEAKTFEGDGFFGVVRDSSGQFCTMAHGGFGVSDVTMICDSLCRVFGRSEVMAAISVVLMLGKGGSKDE